jgi:ParB family chromosome partitioning protein
LAEKLGDRDLTSAAVGVTSDARFEGVLSALKEPRPPAPRPTTVKASSGHDMAQGSRKAGKTVLSFDQKTNQGFDDWLVENLERIHRDWANAPKNEG